MVRRGALVLGALATFALALTGQAAEETLPVARSHAGFPLPPCLPTTRCRMPRSPWVSASFSSLCLSVTGKYSCASCHAPAKAFTDGRALGISATGQHTANGAMSLANVGYNTSFGWYTADVRSPRAADAPAAPQRSSDRAGIDGTRRQRSFRRCSPTRRYRKAFSRGVSRGARAHRAAARREEHRCLRAHAHLRSLTVRSLRLRRRP